MKVLIITGDKNFVPGHPRFELQKSAVDELAAVYWGRDALWPRLPQGHFDVVSAQDPFWRGLYAWIAAKRLRAHLNVQVHTDLAAQPPVRHVLAQIILRHAASVRAVSQKIKEQVERTGAKAPVRVLPVYIDVKRFEQIIRHPHPQKIILWVGRFEPEKDPLRAIAVLKEVREKSINSWLIMLGAGSLEPALRQEALGLPVEFPGWQEPDEYLKSADVLLCTSLHEGFGAAIAEALAAGVPAVAPDVGIAREAGAVIAPREKLPDATAAVLRLGERGSLRLKLLDAPQWAAAWRDTLTV